MKYTSSIISKGINHCYKHQPCTSVLTRSTLFLHGLYGTKEEWDEVAFDARILSETNSFTLDAVNHGGTSHNEKMTFEDQADYVIDFMDKLEIQKAVLIGHSMGGRASMKTALMYPERVEAVISVDSPACSFAHIPSYVERTYAM